MPRVTESKYLVMAGWDDVPHLSERTKRELLDGTPVHLQRARSQGIPTLGSGAVFPVDEESIKCVPIPIPAHWPQLVGYDFGWDHPAAASRLAWDRDNDCVYVTGTYRKSHALIESQVAALNAMGAWIPVAWPHDGYQVKDANTGEQHAEQMRKAGANMRPEHAKFAESTDPNEKPTSRISTEAGIQEILTRMTSNRFKVFSTLSDWWEEFRLYHRKDGLIVKLRDDLMSATRIGIMDLRFAITEPRAQTAIDHNRRSDAY